MFELFYKPHSKIEDMSPGDCTIRRCQGEGGKEWWNLWFYVPRETDGVLEYFEVPVNPGGVYTENGPGGKTWGLLRSGPDKWQVSPSINVLQGEGSQIIHAGPHSTLPSLWHQTPAIVGVPDGEPWQ